MLTICGVMTEIISSFTVSGSTTSGSGSSSMIGDPVWAVKYLKVAGTVSVR